MMHDSITVINNNSHRQNVFLKMVVSLAWNTNTHLVLVDLNPLYVENLT
jgi:hypothetical protein